MFNSWRRIVIITTIIIIISNTEVFQFLNIYFSCLIFVLASRVQWNVTNVDFFQKPSAFEILYFFTLDNIPYFEFWTRNIQYLNTLAIFFK